MRLELEPFIECRGVKLLLAVLDVFANSFRETFDNVKDTLLIVQLVGECLFAVISELQKLGNVELKALDFLFDVGDLLVNDVKGSEVFASIFDFDLNEQLEVLTEFGKPLCVLHGLWLLSAYINGRVDVENALASGGVLGLFDELRDFVVLLQFDVAVQKQCGIVLVVIVDDVEVALEVRSLDQSLEIFDQVRQVLHFDVPLDYIRWVEVADGLDVLVKRLLRPFLLVVELVSVLLADLGVDFSREVGPQSDGRRLLEHASFEEVLNLDVVIDLAQLVDSQVIVLLARQQEHGLLLDFDLNDLLVGNTEDGQHRLKVIDLELFHGGWLVYFDFDDILFVELDHFLLAVEAEVILLHRVKLVEATQLVLTVLPQVESNVAGVVDVHDRRGEGVRLVVVGDGAADAVDRFVFIDSFEEQDFVLVSDIEVVLAVAVRHILVPDEEHIEDLLVQVLVLDDFIFVEVLLREEFSGVLIEHVENEDMV